MLTLRFFSALD
uniref:Uncharacterized protein n=1 Tax=Rhizophora mucronata TaxID=61149 RepID=A0A2P2QIP3_RHIMU